MSFRSAARLPRRGCGWRSGRSPRSPPAWASLTLLARRASARPALVPRRGSRGRARARATSPSRREAVPGHGRRGADADRAARAGPGPAATLARLPAQRRRRSSRSRCRSRPRRPPTPRQPGHGSPPATEQNPATGGPARRSPAASSARLRGPGARPRTAARGVPAVRAGLHPDPRALGLQPAAPSRSPPGRRRTRPARAQSPRRHRGPRHRAQPVRRRQRATPRATTPPSTAPASPAKKSSETGSPLKQGRLSRIASRSATASSVPPHVQEYAPGAPRTGGASQRASRPMRPCFRTDGSRNEQASREEPTGAREASRRAQRSSWPSAARLVDERSEVPSWTSAAKSRVLGPKKTCRDRSHPSSARLGRAMPRPIARTAARAKSALRTHTAGIRPRAQRSEHVDGRPTATGLMSSAINRVTIKRAR